MDLGIVVGQDGRRGRGLHELGDLATAAESMGIATLWAPEHVVFVAGALSKYPYSETGELNLGRRPGVFDPLIALAYVAGRTERIRLATGVLILPEREPLTLAQQVVALDHASGGRFDLGVGVGWLREEFEALGVPWERRGERTDEYLAALEVLWRDEVCSFEGEFTSFRDVLAYPKPLQQPHPPVWVGGNTAPALRRTARYGDGWFGWSIPREEIGARLTRLGAACEEAGRDPATLRVKLGLAWPHDVADLRPYIEAVADHDVEELVVALAAPRSDLRARVEQLAALGPVPA